MMEFSTMDWIVAAVVLLTAAFTVAWASSAQLRTWIERPKYRFLSDVESYDETVAERK